jgi:hypothetical protein
VKISLSFTKSGSSLPSSQQHSPNSYPEWNQSNPLQYYPHFNPHIESDLLPGGLRCSEMLRCVGWYLRCLTSQKSDSLNYTAAKVSYDFLPLGFPTVNMEEIVRDSHLSYPRYVLRITDSRILIWSPWLYWVKRISYESLIMLFLTRSCNFCFFCMQMFSSVSSYSLNMEDEASHP